MIKKLKGECMLNLPKITQPSTGTYPSEKPLFSGLQQNTVVFHNSEELLINNPCNGDSVTLSYTNTTVYSESTYTAEGYAGFSTSEHGNNIAAINSKVGSSAVQEAQSSLSLNRMMEQIQERVFFLLRAFVEQLTGEESKSFLQSPDNTVNSASNSASAPFLQTISLTITEQYSVAVSSVSTNSGYYTAENTADRIIRFALSFYDGGDRQAYAEMARSAVMKGYREAMASFGGVLPSVSHRTIEMVNSALESFASGDDVNISA